MARQDHNISSNMHQQKNNLTIKTFLLDTIQRFYTALYTTCSSDKYWIIWIILSKLLNNKQKSFHGRKEMCKEIGKKWIYNLILYKIIKNTPTVTFIWMKIANKSRKVP